MPGLGKKLYDKIANELLPNDKDSQKLQESLYAMATVFRSIKDALSNVQDQKKATLFLDAINFCNAMHTAVESSATNSAKSLNKYSEYYQKFDEALELLCNGSDESSSLLHNHLADAALFAINNAEPDLPKNSSYAPKIEYNQNKYNNLIQKTKEKGRAIPIGIGEQLIKGIKGLQTYIKEGLAEDKIDNDLDNDLNEKIKHVEEVIQQPQKQQQKLESIKNENEHKNDIFKKDKSDLIENNIIDNKKSDIIAPIKNSGNSKTASEIREMHNFPITFEANSKSYRYSGKFVSAKTSEEKGDWLAKAAAVNVLMQIGIKDTRNPKPTQIFTEDNINEVAAAVKKLPLFKGDMNELENKVFQNKYNPNKMFMLMEQEDINELIVSMGNLNINFGSQKTGPATNQSPQLNQGKNIDDMNTNANDKKSNGKKTGMKP